ncbi:hypothetical protein FRC12_013070 [Ceratobasidium sp. 428]|nr:hypothetical protein FRC12_013070 [Ceratobasidium sp. 428]
MSQRSPLGLRAHRNTHRQALRQFSGSNRDKIDATKAAVAAFDSIDLPVCTFGSLACKMLGVRCHPNDVDLIVLNDDESSQEEHKEFLVRTNRQFYLVPARDPEATYRVLWYRTLRGSRVKVDILHPGAMSIPDFNPSLIDWWGPRSSIPVAPFEVVLLIKLQGWDEHRFSDEPRHFDKHYIDIEHIRRLSDLVPEDCCFNYLSDDFMRTARECVLSFVRMFPDTKPDWRNLGFRVRARRRRRW